MTLNDCLAAATETKAFIVKSGALEELPRLVDSFFGSEAPVFIVADENTYAAAGKSVEELFSSRQTPPAGRLIFPASIHAEYGHVETVREALREKAKDSGLVPLAVGSGTVNDLVKRASSELKLPYCCVPTAASVDGYTAAGAALLYEGFKQTMGCEAALVLAADTGVLSKAPAYLSSSGFGDLAGKIIAGTDWLIADAVCGLDKTVPGVLAIEPKAWDMVQSSLHENLKRSITAFKGDNEALKILFESLAVTGFALQYMKNSRPVSGCEHMWSHVWEMENLSLNGIPVTHGHKVAMGTLAAAAFTECLFASEEAPAPAGGWPSPEEREAEVKKAFAGLNPLAGTAAEKTAREKLLDRDNAARITGMIRDNWKTIRKKTLEKLPPYEKLRGLLAESGCPVRPEEINLSREKVIADAGKSQMIRVRYTVLDLAWDLGIFGEVQKRMEDSGLYLR
jgi:glycerol-1-phosphate dehydrogenase [NAD(P)+]